MLEKLNKKAKHSDDFSSRSIRILINLAGFIINEWNNFVHRKRM